MLVVGHAHVGGVLGLRLLSAQVAGGWGLEETKEGHGGERHGRGKRGEGGDRQRQDDPVYIQHKHHPIVPH